jgi:hypothetical protein
VRLATTLAVLGAALAGTFGNGAARPDAIPVRDCSTSQAGRIPAEWDRGHKVVAGPISFYFYSTLSSLQPFAMRCA